MASLSPSPKMQFFTANGVPLVGGKLYTYVAGGLVTPQTTFTDSTGVTQNTNPIILDSRGEANVWLTDGAIYAFKLTDSLDSLIWTADNISGELTTTSIHNVASKTTPADLDEIPLLDSAASFVLKKLTWANIKTTLAATFAALAGSATQVFSAAAAAAAANVLRADQNVNELTSVSATIATGKLTLGLQPCIIRFRNSDVTNGAPNTKFVTAALTLATDNNGASFGLVTAVQGRLAILAIDDGTAAPRLGVINVSGGVNLDESGVLTSTTAITGAVTSATTVYTTSALGAGLYPYRVVGAVDITWTSGSGFVTTPANVMSSGGNSLTSMSSFGYGQTWQNVAGSRTLTTTYYNTTGKPIIVDVGGSPTTTTGGQLSIQITYAGATTNHAGNLGVATGTGFVSYSAMVPHGASYVVSYSAAGGLSSIIWNELR